VYTTSRGGWWIFSLLQQCHQDLQPLVVYRSSQGQSSEETMMIRSACVATAILCWCSIALTAQGSGEQPLSTFNELASRIGTGDTVYVVDATEGETRGRVATLSDAALTLTVDGARREFAADAIRRIDRRRRDSVRNGVLLGAGAGAALGFAAGRSADSPACPRSGIECGQGALIGTVGGAFWGAVGGWIADALIRKREVVYRSRSSP
jgi:hypothetical protein